MAKFSLICIVLFTTISSYAQIVAHTEDGRRVLLREDGTWKFAAEQPAPKMKDLKIPVKREFLHPKFSTDINADYYYQQEYDEVEDKTRTAVGVKIRDGFYLRFYYYSTGLALKTVPDSVVMMFAAISPSQQFPEGSPLKLSLDGEQVDLGKFKRMARITPNGFREFLYKEISLNMFLRILGADYVGGKLFNTDFVLEREHREAFRDFASRMK